MHKMVPVRYGCRWTLGAAERSEISEGKDTTRGRCVLPSQINLI